MRPKFILTILLLVEIFFLLLLISPEFGRTLRERETAVQMIQKRTPETESAYQVEHAKSKRRQYIVWTLAVLNIMAIIIYGGLHVKKPTEPS